MQESSPRKWSTWWYTCQQLEKGTQEKKSHKGFSILNRWSCVDWFTYALRGRQAVSVIGVQDHGCGLMHLVYNILVNSTVAFTNKYAKTISYLPFHVEPKALSGEYYFLCLPATRPPTKAFHTSLLTFQPVQHSAPQSPEKG
jgi:hypothetical protein